MEDSAVFNVSFGIPAELVKNAIQTIDAGGDGVITDEQKRAAIKASLEGEGLLDAVTEELLNAFHAATSSSKWKVKVSVEISN